VSNPASPTLVGTYDTSGTSRVVQVVGKYAYLADATGGFLILDISGIETPSLYAGSIQTNDLTITENVDVANNLYVRNGLNVGPSGIFTDGRLSVGGVSYFGANVGISTTTPLAKLDVWGSFDVATSSGKIFHVDYGTGNIGVGTSTPAVKLDVYEGLMRAYQTATTTCDTTTEGAFYYSRASKHFYGCDGTNWLKLDN